MTTLHSILAELGIENPEMHPERQADHASDWVTEGRFAPVPGKSYEIAYGKLLVDGEYRTVTKKVRIDGPAPADWFDLDLGMPLDAGLQVSSVKGYRLLE
jgi:hypothetical protein